MGATNHTTNYNLSQFEPTDKPAWLQDYNGDMTKIDTGINTSQLAADAAQLTANTADGKADSANSAITNTITPAISALQTASTNQGGAINTINSLIGNGTPTTTDQTIIGAINEINAEVGTIVSSLNWTALTPVTGTSSVSLPADFKELHVVVDNGTGRWLFNILKDELSASDARYNSGAALQSGGNYFTSIAQIDVSTTALKLHECNANGSSYTATATTSVYYR